MKRRHLLLTLFFTSLLLGNYAQAQVHHHVGVGVGVNIGFGRIITWPVSVGNTCPGHSFWGGFNIPRPPSFGALAYSPSTKKFGVSWGEASRVLAQSFAADYCGAEDCQNIVWVQGGCAAMATPADETSPGLGWAYANTKLRAKSRAIRSCRQTVKGAGCKIVAWTCSR